MQEELRRAQEIQDQMEREAAIVDREYKDNQWSLAQAAFLSLVSNQVLPFAGWVLKEGSMEFEGELTAEEYKRMIEVVRRSILFYAEMRYDDPDFLGVRWSRLYICKR